VRIGERVVDIDRVLLLSRWSGDYASLWRGPAILATPPRPGHASAAVDWLRDRLGVAAPAGTAYDASLQRAVRTWQEARGLPADGIAGPLTLMALADDANAPRLRRTLE
jgi:general secretion pathway protein A